MSTIRSNYNDYGKRDTINSQQVSVKNQRGVIISQQNQQNLAEKLKANSTQNDELVKEETAKQTTEEKPEKTKSAKDNLKSAIVDAAVEDYITRLKTKGETEQLIKNNEEEYKKAESEFFGNISKNLINNVIKREQDKTQNKKDIIDTATKNVVDNMIEREKTKTEVKENVQKNITETITNFLKEIFQPGKKLTGDVTNLFGNMSTLQQLAQKTANESQIEVLQQKVDEKQAELNEQQKLTEQLQKECEEIEKAKAEKENEIQENSEAMKKLDEQIKEQIDIINNINFNKINIFDDTDIKTAKEAQEKITDLYNQKKMLLNEYVNDFNELQGLTTELAAKNLEINKQQINCNMLNSFVEEIKGQISNIKNLTLSPETELNNTDSNMLTDNENSDILNNEFDKNLNNAMEIFGNSSSNKEETNYEIDDLEEKEQEREL